ncbi:MAG TPA: hypothetical protein VIS73_03450 [Rhodocyclaceae bacterium]
MPHASSTTSPHQRSAHPAGELRRLLLGRGLRAFCDGYVAILLPVYLLALGLDPWSVGAISSATLLGSALMTLAIGQHGHRYPSRGLLLAGASPALGGALFAAGWLAAPLLLFGGLKIAYDLAIWRAFRGVTVRR